MPVSSFPESIAFGDLDGDNKPDIAVANNDDPGIISILINSSSGGIISFATQQIFLRAEILSLCGFGME